MSSCRGFPSTVPRGFSATRQFFGIVAASAEKPFAWEEAGPAAYESGGVFVLAGGLGSL